MAYLQLDGFSAVHSLGGWVSRVMLHVTWVGLRKSDGPWSPGVRRSCSSSGSRCRHCHSCRCASKVLGDVSSPSCPAGVVVDDRRVCGCQDRGLRPQPLQVVCGWETLAPSSGEPRVCLLSGWQNPEAVARGRYTSDHFEFMGCGRAVFEVFFARPEFDPAVAVDDDLADYVAISVEVYHVS